MDLDPTRILSPPVANLSSTFHTWERFPLLIGQERRFALPERRYGPCTLSASHPDLVPKGDKRLGFIRDRVGLSFFFLLFFFPLRLHHQQTFTHTHGNLQGPPLSITLLSPATSSLGHRGETPNAWCSSHWFAFFPTGVSYRERLLAERGHESRALPDLPLMPSPPPSLTSPAT